MNDSHPLDPRFTTSNAAPSERDLEALAAESLRSVPSLDDSIDRARRRHAATPTWKEQLMPIATSVARRPWLATTALAALLVIAALVVPVSYQRVVGNDVTLTLAGLRDDSPVPSIAREMKTLLGAEHVRVKEAIGSGGSTLSFTAYAPKRSGLDVATRAQALARELNARGFTASAITVPRRELVSGTVYAYAKDQVIRIESKGKSAAQIEAEIRQRLAEAGIPNAQVSVTDEGNQRKIKVEMQSRDHAAEPQDLRLELTKDGQPIAGKDAVTLQVKKLRDASGTALHLDFDVRGRATEIVIPHIDGMSDAALQNEIVNRLHQAGLDLNVKVQGGQIQIDQK